MNAASRAVLKVARAAIIAEGTVTAVYRDLAPAETNYPLAILTLVSSETLYEHKGRPEVVRLRVVIIAEDAGTADAGAFAVESAINLKGTQQVASGALDASADGWEVIVTRKLRDQFPPAELVEGTMIHRAGIDVEFKLERS
jgi:hypothetical protein